MDSLQVVDDSDHRHRITAVFCRAVNERKRPENQVSDRLRLFTVRQETAVICRHARLPPGVIDLGFSSNACFSADECSDRKKWS